MVWLYVVILCNFCLSERQVEICACEDEFYRSPKWKGLTKNLPYKLC